QFSAVKPKITRYTSEKDAQLSTETVFLSTPLGYVQMGIGDCQVLAMIDSGLMVNLPTDLVRDTDLVHRQANIGLRRIGGHECKVEGECRRSSWAGRSCLLFGPGYDMTWPGGRRFSWLWILEALGLRRPSVSRRAGIGRKVEGHRWALAGFYQGRRSQLKEERRGRRDIIGGAEAKRVE
ncbi:hypothetical protein VP01_6697g1, partial [Puccinia sorghi]